MEQKIVQQNLIKIDTQVPYGLPYHNLGITPNVYCTDSVLLSV